ALGIPGVDETEGYVQYRHDEPQLPARRGAQLLDLERITLGVGLAGVVEEEEAQRPADVDVVLGVEEHELVAAQGVVGLVDGAHRPHVVAPDLRLAPQEEALVERQDVRVPEGLDVGDLPAYP